LGVLKCNQGAHIDACSPCYLRETELKEFELNEDRWLLEAAKDGFLIVSINFDAHGHSQNAFEVGI